MKTNNIINFDDAKAKRNKAKDNASPLKDVLISLDSVVEASVKYLISIRNDINYHNDGKGGKTH